MTSGLDASDSILVAAFQAALLHQAFIIAAILVILLLIWGATRGWVTAAADARAAFRSGLRESAGRCLLRFGFGVLWLLDGLLQAQPQMPGGLPDQVLQPAAATSPAWVQHLVNWGVSAWTFHPVQAAAASVWIQAGIGLWLIVAVRGWSSRLAGVASVAWGLVVWAFGEAFGGIFAPGLTVLFGAPGAALIYAVAGLLIALPNRVWRTSAPGRVVLGCTGAFLLGMAVLQAWPGRGFWQGTTAGQPGSLTGMVQTMAGVTQPQPLSAAVTAFGNFTAAHGWGVNLFAVIALAALGAAFCAGALPQRTFPAGRRIARIGVLAGVACCFADWVLVEDFGFFGGVGTDPNSMVPLILLFTAGYLALTPTDTVVPAAVPADESGGTAEPATAAAHEPPGGGWPPVALRERVAQVGWQAIAAIAAAVVIAVGAVPMAFASVNRTADPITAQAIAGTNGQLDTPAPDFHLISQDGRPVALSGLRGKVVLLAFLDPVCTTDCPLIAQEMRSADALLGAKASSTELVAVVANPTYTSPAFTAAFTRQEGLDQLPNWLYLTGSLSQLQQVWHHFDVAIENLPAGAMSAHNDIAFVIDAAGRVRQEINDDPGPGTAATKSSFSSLLADSVLQVMSGGH
jgi:cytochrome oxidase Cu insertion factor (SCO1/SenC/PrrC family)